jgi:hypothetical protein
VFRIFFLDLLVISHVTDEAEACPAITKIYLTTWYSVFNIFTISVLRSMLKNWKRILLSGILLPVVFLFLLSEKMSGQTGEISGSATVCQNGASPVITFLAANGAAPYTFTYSVNGVDQPSVSTATNENSVVISAPAGTPGTFEYVLISITDGGGNIFTITVNTATIKVNPLPSAVITGVLTSCATSTLTAVTDAVSPAYVWYKDDVVIDGQTASGLDVTTSGDYKVKILDLSTGCEQISPVSTVKINPLPATSAIRHQ